MKEEIIYIAATWAVKSLIDFGVKKSKSTENTVDDFIFMKLKILSDSIFGLFKKKNNSH